MSRVSFANGTKTEASGSPLKGFRSGTVHSSTKVDLKHYRGELRFNMHRKVTILEHQLFITKFIGEDGGEDVDIFGDLATPVRETDMYSTIPDRVNHSGICPGYVFIAHPHGSDKSDPSKQAVDCGMYLAKFAPQVPAGSSYASIDWSELDLPAECKTDPVKHDPLEDDSPDNEPTADSRIEVWGQLLSYAELIFRYQQRTHFYLILYLGDEARLFRFDRSSIFATKRFNYKTDPSKLSLFLSRYARLSPEKRGYDQTAERVRRGSKLWNLMSSKRDIKKDSDDHAHKLFIDSLDEKWPWWQLKVPVGGDGYKRFLVGKPHFIAPGVAGRGTRGYVALPLDTMGRAGRRYVYLKDAWRVDHPGIEQEGSILKQLNEKKVPYIPTLLCHGDLSGPEQVTDWKDFWKECHNVTEDSDCPLKKHQHYRLVVKEVGKPLHEFGDSSSQLILALLSCLIAHHYAYAAGIVHRDISAGNILLVKDKDGDWVGMLNDWELSKKVETKVTETRQPDRTGTWQFMSAHALNDEERQISIEDELESILHVLIYIAIRFLRSNLDAKNVGRFLHDYFDSYTPVEAGYRCGVDKLGAMEHGIISLRRYNGDKDGDRLELKFYWPIPSAQPPAPAPEDSQAVPESSPPSSQQRPSSPSPQVPSTAPSTAPSTPPDVDPSKDHPINKILSELLSWFKAYYAEDKAAKRLAAMSTGTVSETSVGPKLKIKSGFKRTYPDGVDSADASTSEDSTPKDVPKGEEETKRAALRDKLRNHNAIIALFSNTYENAIWPPHDRVEDMRPKDGYVVPKDHGRTGTTTTSRKRSLDDDDASSRKRSKV